MTLPRTLLMATILLAALLGGCVSEDSTKQQSAPPAVTTQDTGGIQGLVTDEEQVPVAGASVGVRQLGGPFQNQTTSAPDGTFSFSAMAPGEYGLIAQSPFFEAGNLKVVVAISEISPVTIVLKRIPAPAEALVETTTKKGFITCSVGWTITTGTYYSNPCQQVLGNDANFKVPLKLDLAFKEIVLELVWQPGSPSSGTTLRMNLCSEKEATTNYYGPCVAAVGSNPYYQGVAGRPPLVMRRGDLPLKTVKTYEVAVGDGGLNQTSVRVPVTFQQSFDLYTTICYNQNCTAAFQARPPS